MSPKRILVVGNHTCGNRGDAAILRGLLETIGELVPDSSVDVISRYPVSSQYLLGRPVIADPFHGNALLPGRFSGRVLRRLLPWLLLLNSRENGRGFRWLLPASVKRQIERLKKYDLVIQVGGSFFVDLYGYRQFEAGFAAMAAGCPLVLAGHSIGPIAGGRYPTFMRHLLKRSRLVALREGISRELLEAADMPLAHVESGSDTAWAVTPRRAFEGSVKNRYFGGDKRPVVAITVRVLAPFDQRLGTTQTAFEQAFAGVVDRIVAAGYNVLAVSTCTGIDSYHRDDRMVALRIGEQVTHGDHYQVVMDELNDVELGDLISQCDLLLGTRLHSAIIALNFGTPALALNYEHKSKGILTDMGLGSLSIDIGELLDGSLRKRIVNTLANLPALREEIRTPVERERQRVRAMVGECFEAVGIEHSAGQSATGHRSEEAA